MARTIKDFAVGMTVKCVDVFASRLTVGKEYTVTKLTHLIFVINDNGYEEGYFPERLNPVSNKKEGENMSKSWSFKAIAPYLEVDLTTIDKDISRSNPVALISVDGEKEWSGFVMLHSSIGAKAVTCGYEDTVNKAFKVLDSGTAVFEVGSAQEFKWYVEFAKKIKAAQWPEEEKNKGTVTISLPTI